MSDPNRERWKREASDGWVQSSLATDRSSYRDGYLAACEKHALDVAEVDDWRESARKAAEEPCGDERHCACVGLLREELKLAHAAAELHIGIGARAIRARAEAEEQRDRWYAAAGHRAAELNEAHRALAWVCGSLPLDAPNLPEHLRPPEFVRRQVAQAKAAWPTVMLDELWSCPDCGVGVAADEDGCCANCGADCDVVPAPPPPGGEE